MSFNGQISGSLAPQGAKQGNLSGNIGAVTPAIRDGAVTTAKLADEAVTTAKLADAAVTIAKLAQDVTALINSKGDASDVEQLQDDVAALQTITAGLGTASTYGVANNLTQAAAGSAVLDAYQGKLLGDRMTTAEGDIASLNDGYAQLNEVKDISSRLTVSEGWAVNARKCGKLVTLVFYTDRDITTYKSYITVCTLPSDLRPTMFVRFIAYDNKATTANCVVVGTVNNVNGNMNVWTYYANTRPSGCVEFLVD